MPIESLINDYLPILVLLVLATGLACLIVIIGTVMGPKKPSQTKGMAYESGMTPIGSAVRRVPIRYYLVAVLFILFDIEVMFFVPWAVSLKKMGAFSFWSMMIFTFVLTIGLIYEWKVGALDWE